MGGEMAEGDVGAGRGGSEEGVAYADDRRISLGRNGSVNVEEFMKSFQDPAAADEALHLIQRSLHASGHHHDEEAVPGTSPTNYVPDNIPTDPFMQSGSKFSLDSIWRDIKRQDGGGRGHTGLLPALQDVAPIRPTPVRAPSTDTLVPGILDSMRHSADLTAAKATTSLALPGENEGGGGGGGAQHNVPSTSTRGPITRTGSRKRSREDTSAGQGGGGGGGSEPQTLTRYEKRMMKNRESAARSRKRKLDYAKELEEQIRTLQTRNSDLKRQLESAIKEGSSVATARTPPHAKKLRRTLSTEF